MDSTVIGQFIVYVLSLKFFMCYGPNKAIMSALSTTIAQYLFGLFLYL